MGIKVTIEGGHGFQLFYQAEKFATHKNVTGYLIFPDMSKSETFVFNELGDGIYEKFCDYERKTDSHIEKYGLVVKEDATVKFFDIIHVER